MGLCGTCHSENLHLHIQNKAQGLVHQGGENGGGSDRPRKHWKDYVSELACENFRMPLEELDGLFGGGR